MSKIKTFRGKIPPTVEEKIHLSTNTGMTGYRIRKFQILSATPGSGAAVELVMKIRITADPNIGPAVDFNDTDLLAVAYYQDNNSSSYVSSQDIIFDQETFNQDIFITCSDANSGSVPGNFYIELEQFPLDLNSSTYHTLKNIRSRTQ